MKYFSKILLTIFFLALIRQRELLISAEQQNPGAQLRITSTGLNYASSVAVKVMTRNIVGRSVPDQSGIDRLDVGRVKWQVKDMTITDFTKPTTTVDLRAGQAMKWTISGAGMKTTGSWRYEYRLWRIKVKDSGSFNLEVRGVSAIVKVALERALNGKPRVRVLGCTSNIENVDVEFVGGRDWLYNLFSSAIERPIKKELERAVCEEATKVIDDSGNEELATLELDVSLVNGMNIDCHLIEDPIIGDGYIMTSHKGRAEFPGDTSSLPLQAPPLQAAPTSLPSRMITLHISQYAANTIGYLFQKHGNLTHILTKDDVPTETSKEFFGTTCPSRNCFGSLFPAAATMFPNAIVELNMTCLEPPTLHITPQQATGKFKGKLEVLAKLPRTPMIRVMSLEVSADLNLAAEMQGNSIKAQVTSLVPSITLEHSMIGSAPAARLGELMQKTAENFIIPQLNAVLEDGFVLPSMDGLELVDPILTLVEGGMILSTDVRYIESPTTETVIE